MWQRTAFSLALLPPMCVALTACPPPGQEPDLIPERRAGGNGAEGFCQRDTTNGNLIVVVRNQTNELAQAHTTKVSFLPGGDVEMPTPFISGGAAAFVQFPFPASCFDPDCEFRIHVDVNNDVDESHGDGPDNHESNNIENGVCIG